jgi:hypothetical protein
LKPTAKPNGGKPVCFPLSETPAEPGFLEDVQLDAWGLSGSIYEVMTS